MRSKYFFVFALILVALSPIFFSCSFDSPQKSYLKFKLDKETVQKIKENVNSRSITDGLFTDNKEFFLEISLDGERIVYSTVYDSENSNQENGEQQTVEAPIEKFAVSQTKKIEDDVLMVFDEIDVGTTLKASAIIYAQDVNSSSKIIYFEGVSSEITIEEGENILDLQLQACDVKLYYTVKHFFQNLSDDDYTENEEIREILTSTIGSSTQAACKQIQGFTSKEFSQEQISLDGSTVISIYYDRNTYSVRYALDIDEDIVVPDEETYRYGETVLLNFSDIGSREDYIFVGWLLEDSSSASSSTLYSEEDKTSFEILDNVKLVAKWLQIGCTLYISPEGSSENDGSSIQSPLSSIFDAVNIIEKNDSTETVWTIYLDGIFTSYQEFYEHQISSANGKIINLIGYNGLDSNGVPKDGIDANILEDPGEDSYHSALTVGTDIPVYIKNILITHGYAKDGGGGLYVSGTASVTLGSGVLITENEGGVCGGGINVAVGGSLTIEDGCVISNNTAYNSGAGIMNRGTLIMEGGSIIQNKSMGEGQGWSGGVTNEGSFTMNDGLISQNESTNTGAGVTNSGNIDGDNEDVIFIMNGGTISDNVCSWQGGGVRNTYRATFILTDGEISGNKADHGGAIVTDNYSNTFIKGGKIINNTAYYNGGAICIGDTTTVTISGGIFTENYAVENGGAIYIELGEESSGILNVKDDAYIPYEEDTNPQDVFIPLNMYEDNNFTNAYITVSGSLNETEVLTISVQEYIEGSQVIKGTNDINLTSDAVNKFSLLNAEYHINDDGSLGLN